MCLWVSDPKLGLLLGQFIFVNEYLRVVLRFSELLSVKPLPHCLAVVVTFTRVDFAAMNR